MSVATTTAERALLVEDDVTVHESFSVRVAMVTPEQAEAMLRLNMRNRKEKTRKQVQFASDIVNRKWLLTGQAIQFDWNGELVDGQNRLRAIIAAGVPAPCMIVTGLDPAVRGVVDTGSARTAGDSVAILDGHANPNNLAALAKLAISWDMGFTWLNNYKPTHSEIREYVNANVSTLEHSVHVGKHVARNIPGSATFWAFAHYAAAASSPEDRSVEDADHFFRTVADGSELSKDDPRLVLRNRITKDAHIRGPAAEFDKRALIFRAWNAWRDHEPMTKLQAPRGVGWTHKNFPRPY